MLFAPVPVSTGDWGKILRIPAEWCRPAAALPRPSGTRCVPVAGWQTRPFPTNQWVAVAAKNLRTSLNYFHAPDPGGGMTSKAGLAMTQRPSRSGPVNWRLTGPTLWEGAGGH